ncbi:MAG: MarR family transcriptional regulator [Pseudomonadota bacterium]|nr:MarR family transcriptional regulator [Pseudomonadota bacterium]HJO34612.1 MarR family transcriptional regulator [Gammaproteobacteria bacterium]
MEDYVSEIGPLLGRVSRKWRRAVDARLARDGLSQARWLILYYLQQDMEGYTQRELARHLGIEEPTLARTLDHLEGRRLLTRRPCEHDRRAKRLWLTAAGREVLQGLNEVIDETRQALLRDVEPDHLLALIDTLQRIERNWGKAYGLPSARAAESGAADAAEPGGTD